jgi:hypothetical protein
MGSSPENAAAARTEREFIRAFIDKRSNQIFCPFFGQRLQKRIAFDAARMRFGPVPCAHLIENLIDLFPPKLAVNQQGLDLSCPFDQSAVSGQKNSPFGFGQGKKIIVIDFGKKDRVESQNPQPLGQFSQHTIDNEFHGRHGP